MMWISREEEDAIGGARPSVYGRLQRSRVARASAATTGEHLHDPVQPRLDA